MIDRAKGVFEEDRFVGWPFMSGGALLPAGGKTADQEIGIVVVEGENPKAQAGFGLFPRPLPGRCHDHPHARGALGPGRVIHPKKVYAGKDMVGLGVLCCSVLNGTPREVLHLQLAHESGTGQMNPAAGTIKHVRL